MISKIILSGGGGRRKKERIKSFNQTSVCWWCEDLHNYSALRVKPDLGCGASCTDLSIAEADSINKPWNHPLVLGEFLGISDQKNELLLQQEKQGLLSTESQNHKIYVIWTGATKTLSVMKNHTQPGCEEDLSGSVSIATCLLKGNSWMMLI